jgi:superkiller protein 3
MSLRPNSFWDKHNLALFLRQAGRLDEAGAVYRRYVVIDPKRSGPDVNLAGAPRDRRQLEEAVGAFQRTIELDPANSGAFRGLGVALRGQKKLDEANAAFDKAIELDRKAIELDPQSVGPYLLLSVDLCLQEKLDEAIAVLRKVIELDPKHALAHNDLAWYLVARPEAKLQDAKGAVALAKRAVELQPEVGIYWNTLGVAQYRAGDLKAAVVALEKSMELRHGGDSNDWFWLAMARIRLGEEAKARESYDRAVQWMDTNQPNDEVLSRLRDEASELLAPKKKR